jgi:uncharacterized protein (DUF885 family)
MKPMTCGLLLVAVCAGGLSAAHAQSSSRSLEARRAAQSALFEEEYEAELKAYPERATEYGDYRYNDRLNDYSLAGAASAQARDKAFLKRLQAIATTGFDEQDLLSHEVLVRTLEQHLEDHRFKEYEMPVSQVDGPHIHLADLPLAVPFDSVKQYEDYIARLHQIPRAFEQTEQVLRAGLRDQLMPVRFLLEKVSAQCEGVIAADPFVLPTHAFPPSISAAEQQRLTRQITETAEREVLPAYRAFGQFVEREYAPHGRSVLSVTSLSDGEARYRNEIRSRTTVSTLTPEQIHEIGLREMTRIEAEMGAIAHQQGYPDVAAFRASLRTNPKYRPASSEQIVDDFRKYIDGMRPKLPELFGFIPKAPVTVEAMPPFEAARATHYSTGTPDGSRPGRVIVATANFAERSLVDDEATAYHEGIPGHHMQLSVAQELPGLPRFRRHVANSGYIEGWALYAEELGKEVGLYHDPISDYGRLSSELFRAVRLVVDTGIHAKGWSREQVVDFFRKSEAVDEPTLQTETDRYIAWPAQALAYKLGQLKFRELRERARRQLGPGFDVRAFHDEMLNGGVLPLDLLDTRTDAWIRAQNLSHGVADTP